jgi:RNA polymerase sigma factor (sigma-70 family)
MDTHHRTLVTRFLTASCLCIVIFRGPAESARAGQLTVQATVQGTDQPWNFTPGGLNTNFQYGINDGTGPLVLSAADGFNFAQGGSFTITYIGPRLGPLAVLLRTKALFGGYSMKSADVGSTSSSQLRAIRDWKNHQAWVEFQSKYDPLLRSQCQSFRLDGQTTDEICQLTWIEVARRIASFVYDPKKSFRAWLRTVCRNKVWDCFKKAKRDLVLPFEERDEAMRTGPSRSFGEEGPDSDGYRDEDPVIALWRRRAEEVQAAVKARVKPHTWEAFWLLAVRGCDMEETVKMLGISHFSAFKAKERVSRHLRDEGQRRYGPEVE